VLVFVEVRSLKTDVENDDYSLESWIYQESTVMVSSSVYTNLR